MKNIALIGVLAVSLSACAGADNDTQSAQTNVAAEQNITAELRPQGGNENINDESFSEATGSLSSDGSITAEVIADDVVDQAQAVINDVTEAITAEENVSADAQVSAETAPASVVAQTETETQEVIPEPGASTTPIIEAELTGEAAAEYQAEQEAAAAAQAEREEEAKSPEMEILATGSFGGASGHSTSGGVTVKANGNRVIIEIANSFSVDRGPDLYVIASQNQTLANSINTSQIKILEPLISTSGSQIYTMSRADYDAFGHAIVIWCQQYNVVFGSAVLN